MPALPRAPPPLVMAVPAPMPPIFSLVALECAWWKKYKLSFGRHITAQHARTRPQPDPPYLQWSELGAIFKVGLVLYVENRFLKLVAPSPAVFPEPIFRAVFTHI